MPQTRPGFSFVLGRAAGRHPLVTAIGVIALAIAASWWLGDGEPERVKLAPIRPATPAEAEQQRVAAEADAKRAQDERIAAAKAQCARDEAKITAEAKAALKSADASRAIDLLKTCSGPMTNGRLDALFRQAGAMYEKQEAQRAARALASEKARKRREGVSIGMSQQDVLDSSWGRPERVNRTTSARSTHEQWVYPGNQYLYFEDGVLTTVQTSH